MLIQRYAYIVRVESFLTIRLKIMCKMFLTPLKIIIVAFVMTTMKGNNIKCITIDKILSNTTLIPSTRKISLFPENQLTTNACNYANLQIPSIFSHLKFLSMTADSNQRFTIEMFYSNAWFYTGPIAKGFVGKH